MRICMVCFRKFDSVGTETKCPECALEEKEIILFLPCVYIDLSERFIDRWEQFEKQDGNFACYKYKIRLREHKRYTFGITVYDHRDGGQICGNASFRLMKAGKKVDGDIKEYLYLVLDRPQSQDRDYVLYVETINENAIDGNFIWQFFGKSYDEHEIIHWRVVLKSIQN